MQTALDSIARFLTDGSESASTFPWATLRFKETNAVRTFLSHHYAPSTANKRLVALRGVLRQAWLLGHMSAEEFRQAADLPAFKTLASSEQPYKRGAGSR
jgi:hypothetical protein